MHSLAEWLTASRARAFIGSGLLAFLALLVPFCTWLPGAFVVLLALRQGQPLADWVAAVVAGGTFAWGVVQAGAGPLPALLVSLALVLPPLLIGRLLRRGGSLNLGFQLATLAALGLLVVVYAVLADPPGIWRPMLEKLAAELDRVGVVMQNVGSGRRPQDSDLIQASAARMWGVVAWVVLLNTMVAVFVGAAVMGVLERVARLGPAFRELKAGRTLAVVAIVVTLAATVFHWSLAADAAFVFLGAFVLQGLSVLHSARAALGISGFWLVATYLMLFWPFWPYTTVFVQGGLAIFGFMDNWVPLRERFRARPGGGPSGEA
ncbi:MAG: hypothetical protein WCH32_03635 [Pseudomonadota bacterium]